jgi:hypothetical protein
MRLRLIAFFLVVVAVTILLYEFGGTKGGPPHQTASNLNGSPAARFTPFSTSLPTDSKGWVLGTVKCSDRRTCMQLRSTRDGGATWKLESLPAGLLKPADERVGLNAIAAVYPVYPYGLLNVRFANVRDGWIYGTIPSIDRFGGITTSRWLVLLWSTHDGGTTWTKQNPPGLGSQGPTFDLEASSREVYLLGEGLTFTAVLVESPVQSDHWSVVKTPPLEFPAGGSANEGDIVLSGHAGWLVEGNDRGVTGSLRLNQDGQWTRWSPPCASVGDSYAVPVASDTRHLDVVCEIGGVFAQPSPKAPPGATPGSWWLYVSSNAGSSFHAASELHPAGDYFSALAWPTPKTLFSYYGVGFPGELVMSRDEGKSWHVVFHGLVTYLHFVNATNGIGIAESPSNTSEMIVTHNGGQSWYVQRVIS